VLGQNWLPLKLFVADAKERGSFDYLAVTDHHGIVQAATDERAVGKPLAAPAITKLYSQSEALTASSAMLQGGKPIFLFQTPILFQKTVIGRIYLGISQEGTTRVLRATLWLLTALGLISVLAVTGLSYILGAMIARRLRLLRDALSAFGGGDHDRRVARAGSDEIGQLFSAFNRMADQLAPVEGEAAVAPRAVPLPVGEASAGDDTIILKTGS
jgi:methyl-accepting chemotaxis protein